MIRVGAAGSLTMLLSESSFYWIDNINARTKMLNDNVQFHEMLKRVVKAEGVPGLYKGFTASYYSSIVGGFIYFYFYKAIKL